MNKHCYRIVFNKTRGMPMVVAESARSQGGAGAPDGAGDLRANPPPRRVAFALSTLALGVLLITGGMSWSSSAGAQIVADRSAPGARQATVLNTTNGVLQVNIQTPSAAGVSHNVYSQFDVPARGAILNNTRSGANTRLGGLVPGNPWLAGGTARVILNEVNATSPSQLRGYVEVGGDRAEVVIANPAGIVCDGCGFINASRSTLTTGAPLLSNGSLDGFRVQGGRIVVQGAGLDAADSDYTGLIARAVELNAGIWAKDLRVITGAAEVSADAASATALAASGTAPAFALDVALLGGMYANRITLVGAEAGLGMRSAGHIGAAAGEVLVTLDGRLENSGRLTATGAIGVAAAGGIANSGSLYALGDTTLATPADVTSSGLVAAGGNVELSAA
ncbi:MAG: filamentous hemagglutinin N-terminal domain-containing protein, partial [Zoogloea sp.]|nr:filamentous hemagglutinin N-terminal domain-containing protein [Zoogloea sp.]